MRRFVLLLLMVGGLSGTASADGSLETTLQVQSWCKDIANASISSNGSFELPATRDNGFCWGAFAAIQELSRVVLRDKRLALEVCSPAESTRIEYIKIFMRYSGDHPEVGHDYFALVALSALQQAFPCSQ